MLEWHWSYKKLRWGKEVQPPLKSPNPHGWAFLPLPTFFKSYQNDFSSYKTHFEKTDSSNPPSTYQDADVTPSPDR